MFNILQKPVITEKSMRDAADGWFTFAVLEHANKAQIALAIQKMFKVKVVKVKTMIVKGHSKRVGKKRLLDRDQSWKKAIVRLEKDQKIDLFDVAGATQ